MNQRGHPCKLGLLSQRLGHLRPLGTRPGSPQSLDPCSGLATGTSDWTWLRRDPLSLADSRTPVPDPWSPQIHLLLPLTVPTHLSLGPHPSQPLPRPWPRPVTLGCGEEPLTVASSGIWALRPQGSLPPAMSLPSGDTRDSLDGRVPVTPQRPLDGLHVHPELGEAELLEEGTVVGVLAGGGHEGEMHCNDSVWGLSPSGLAARPPRAGLSSPHIRQGGAPVQSHLVAAPGL